MSKPIQREIFYGDNNPPLVWGFGPVDAPEIPLGAEFKLDIDWLLPSPKTLTFTSPTNGLTVDYSVGTVSWNYTVDDTKLIPLAHRTGYTLRIVNGSVIRTWAYGPLIVKTGVPL
jgi:hypothetical protein